MTIAAILVTLIIRTYGGHLTVQEGMEMGSCQDAVSVARYGLPVEALKRARAVVADIEEREGAARGELFPCTIIVGKISQCLGTSAGQVGMTVITTADILEARCVP